MSIGRRKLQDVRATVAASAGWRLSPDEWESVDGHCARLTELLAAGDRPGVIDELDKFKRLDPDRRLPRATLEPEQMTEPVRERRTVLINRIDVLLIDDANENAE